MTKQQFDIAYRASRQRKRFRAFLIEFTSGQQLQIRHPESLRNEGQLYVTRSPDGGFVLFAAESVSRLLDLPIGRSS